MKKPLLALALCLVMMVSLLPITAAAHPSDNPSDYVVGIKDGKTYCGDTYFTLHFPSSVTEFMVKDVDGTQVECVNGRYKLPSGSGQNIITITYVEGTSDAEVFNISVTILDHDWQLTKTENSLTATCQNPELYKNKGGCKCSIGQASLTLDAHSVTLPTSPFNARLEGWEQFQDAIPTAYYEKLVYKYNGPNGWTEVEPTAANAKAGEYQVGVRILGLPDKENGPVAMSLADEVIPDGAGYRDLYVRYTAADPAITAQTGDNRPIELMMAGVLVFSALAAAAFILDSKRKYSR